jgi:hypothetical protein
LILILLLPSQQNIAISNSPRPDTPVNKSGQRRTMMMMMMMNVTLCAHPKLALLVFVWKNFGTKYKETSTPQEITQWIEDHAHAEMVKTGQFELRRFASSAHRCGGFIRVNVSNCKLFNIDNFCALNWFFCFAGFQIHNGLAYRPCQSNSVQLSLLVAMQMLCSFVGEGVPQQVCSAASR